MLRQITVYAKVEGLVTVGVDDDTNMFYVYDKESDWPTRKLSLLENEYINESGALNKLFLFFKHLATRDLSIVPEQDFVFVNKENQRGIIRYDIGTGYLYPSGNLYFYVSKRRSSMLARKLPLDVRGATIEVYKAQMATYIIRDHETDSTFMIPSYVLNLHDHLDNPLLHFQPISVYTIETMKEVEWEKVPDIPVQVYREVENIGTTDNVFIKDSNNVIYKTRVNYAALANMSKYRTSDKLISGLKRLSAPGVYLWHLDPLVKYIVGEGMEWI